MKKSFILAASAAAVVAFASQPSAAETLRLMTGPQGGVWVPLGGSLKNMWEKAMPGVTVQALPGAGIANVKGIQENKTEIGFANSVSTVDGVAGRAPFDKKQDNVCQMATLYPQYFQIVALADAKINTVDDLKGKHLAVQPKGNTAEDISRHILQVHGLDYTKMGKVSYVSYTDAVALMKDGHAQAFTLGTTIPASSVMDLAASRDIKLLDIGGKIGDMKKINPGYTLNTVKAGTYPKIDKDVKVIGYATHLVVSCKLAEDKVYAMTKAIASNIPDMVAVNKAMDGLTPKMMAEDIGVPLHPGARKFYKEAGAL
ncbi:MAG: TAXI family TRAP transporter solute-binding subunit [Alphaproteobacteria bacterium]|nr:TAXI family TRAP transporter solute-binding subunit [Alphaproteobacteria bacterium]